MPVIDARKICLLKPWGFHFPVVGANGLTVICRTMTVVTELLVDNEMLCHRPRAPCRANGSLLPGACVTSQTTQASRPIALRSCEAFDRASPSSNHILMQPASPGLACQSIFGQYPGAMVMKPFLHVLQLYLKPFGPTAHIRLRGLTATGQGSILMSATASTQHLSHNAIDLLPSPLQTQLCASLICIIDQIPGARLPSCLC